MAQKIPFFELFPTLELPWELRASLGEGVPHRRGGWSGSAGSWPWIW